jgi:hypothetical protein
MKGAAKPFTTPLVPPLESLNFPAIPKDAAAAHEAWRRLFWEARKYARLASMNTDPHTAGHFNPEYFLDDWTHALLESERLRRDVWGWALHALESEEGHRLGGDHHSGNMLSESRAIFFLERFKVWAEARLAYHRLALRLAFYSSDPLASKEPLASDVERLKARLADWRDVKLKEGLTNGAKTREWIDWLRSDN